MSLNVYLESDPFEKDCECSNCGNSHKYTAKDELYWANITHNLNSMAEAAGIYTACWRPDEGNFKKAKDIIEPLRAGLAALKADPEKFEKYNASNGWGLYENFVPWVEKYLAACEEYSEANIRVSR